MSDEEQGSNQEATQSDQKPPPRPAAKLRYTPAFWIALILLALAIYIVERLFVGGTLVIMVGPLVAMLVAWLIASRWFPPVKN